MGKMMPHAVAGKVQTPPPLWPKYWSICTKGRKRNLFVLNAERDFPCTILLAG
jgi:hypothetical protein